MVAAAEHFSLAKLRKAGNRRLTRFFQKGGAEASDTLFALFAGCRRRSGVCRGTDSGGGRAAGYWASVDSDGAGIEHRLEHGGDLKAASGLSPGLFRWWMADRKAWLSWQDGEVAPPVNLMRRDGVWTADCLLVPRESSAECNGAGHRGKQYRCVTECALEDSY